MTQLFTFRNTKEGKWTPGTTWRVLARPLQIQISDPTQISKQNARDAKQNKKSKKNKEVLVVLSPSLQQIHEPGHLHGISGFWWGTEWGSPGIGLGSNPPTTHKPQSSTLTTGPHPRPLTTLSLQLRQWAGQ